MAREEDFEKLADEREARVAVLVRMLATAGYRAGSPDKREAMGRRLALAGCSPEHLQALMDHASATATGAPDGLLAHFLERTDWKTKAQDLIDSAEFRSRKPAKGRPVRMAPQRAKENRQADMEWARADNPYGWRPDLEDGFRELDHNRPGEWNAFRSAMNLTVEQAAAAGRKPGDFRVRGCTRWAVVGDSVRHGEGEARTPTLEWDERCRELASETDGPRAFVPPAGLKTPEEIGRVYGG